MKRIITAVVSTLAAQAVLALLVLRFGLVPVSADVAPPRLETNLMGMALRASVARHADRPPITVPRHVGQLPVAYDYKPSKAYWLREGWGKKS